MKLMPTDQITWYRAKSGRYSHGTEKIANLPAPPVIKRRRTISHKSARIAE